MTSIRKQSRRALLTEMLPFELPASMTNRQFWQLFEGVNLRADFHSAKSTKSHFVINFSDDYSRFAICLYTLLGTNFHALEGSGVEIEAPTGGPYKILLKKSFSTEPFRFSVRHKIGSDRHLSIMHPLMQLQFCEFLDRNAEYIVHLCSRSPYSVRRPAKVASLSVSSWINRKMGTIDAVRESADQGQELTSRASDSFRSYFVYEPFSQAHQYHQSNIKSVTESKFLFSGHLDIQSCFDSIYTHSIEWAGLGYRFAKDMRRESFFSEFDRLMQNSNMGETNGILIGSEISRIFAEVILQAIDCELEQTLRNEEHLSHGIDYAIHRYVDDYHIYTNSHENFEIIERRLAAVCNIYKLRLSQEKRAVDKNPHSYNRSVAKNSLEKRIRQETWLPGFKHHSVDDVEFMLVDDGSYWRSPNLKNTLQEILLATQVEAPEIAGYALHVVNLRTIEIVNYLATTVANNRKNKKTPDEDVWKLHKYAAYSLVSLAELATFIFQCSPKVGPALKLGQLAISLSKCSDIGFPPSLIDSVLQGFADDMKRLLFRERGLANYPVERSYLMHALTQLGPHYALIEDELIDILDLAQDFENNDPENWLLDRYDYLTIISILHYGYACKINSSRIQTFCFKWLEWRIQLLKNEQGTFFNAEIGLIASDCLTSPALSSAQKRSLRKLLFHGFDAVSRGFNAPAISDNAQGQSRSAGLSWWQGYDFPAAMALKQSGVVY